jgi:hypothetical protein
MRVINKLEYEAITVHLHGVDKRHLWFTDGVSVFCLRCILLTFRSLLFNNVPSLPDQHTPTDSLPIHPELIVNFRENLLLFYFQGSTDI